MFVSEGLNNPYYHTDVMAKERTESTHEEKIQTLEEMIRDDSIRLKQMKRTLSFNKLTEARDVYEAEKNMLALKALVDSCYNFIAQHRVLVAEKKSRFVTGKELEARGC
jgi:hypothetical protein